MFKKNKVSIILSTLTMLLPTIFGLIFWNQIPTSLPGNLGNNSNDKVFIVFILPLIFIIGHLICLLVTLLDKKQKDQTAKALSIVFWIMPFLSLVINGVFYTIALGKDFNLLLFIPIISGLMFVLMGNYLPKVKQNRTIGIKLPWTLSNEENWNKTHRFGGKVWVIGGLIMVFTFLLPLEIMIIAMILVIAINVIVPTYYSYAIYKKHQKEGIVYEPIIKSRTDKIVVIVMTLLLVVILIGSSVFLFTGDVRINYSDNSLKVSATYYQEVEVKLSDIDNYEYRDDFDVGLRVIGFGSFKLLAGTFKNEELGTYTLYATTNAIKYAIIELGKNYLVIGLDDLSSWDELVNQLNKVVIS